METAFQINNDDIRPKFPLIAFPNLIQKKTFRAIISAMKREISITIQEIDLLINLCNKFELRSKQDGRKGK